MQARGNVIVEARVRISPEPTFLSMLHKCYVNKKKHKILKFLVDPPYNYTYYRSGTLDNCHISNMCPSDSGETDHSPCRKCDVLRATIAICAYRVGKL